MSLNCPVETGGRSAGKGGACDVAVVSLLGLEGSANGSRASSSESERLGA